MTSKIRIKMGAIEVEFEGSEEYIETNLLQLIEAIAGFQEKGDFGKEAFSPEVTVPPTDYAQSTYQFSELSMIHIVSRLGLSTGTDLVLAACLKLHLEGIDKFNRKQINEKMKEATGYYQRNYTRNLTRYLDTLVKNKKLHSLSNSMYSLSASTKRELESKLAD